MDFKEIIEPKKPIFLKFTKTSKRQLRKTDKK